MAEAMALEDPVSAHCEVGARMEEALKEAGIATVGELLRHYPQRYENRLELLKREEIAMGMGEPVVVLGRVVRAECRYFGRVKSMTEVELLSEEAGEVTLRWFNMAYIHRSLSAGDLLVARGRVKEVKEGWLIDHPDHEKLEAETRGGVHWRAVTPVYPTRKGLPQGQMREMMAQVLVELRPEALGNYLPKPRKDGEFAGMDRLAAVREVHFPTGAEALEKARRYLALEEFVALQLGVLGPRVRRELAGGGAHAHAGAGVGAEFTERRMDDGLLRALVEDALPFRPTKAQEKVIQEIQADMSEGAPMQRLLQGDVGSGKTVVAMAALALNAGNGGTGVVMAPTQLLAEQHARVMRKYLEPLGIPVSLRTASHKEEAFPGPGGVMVGTHALLFAEGKLGEPDLIVIDEQHKFGVGQRARLIQQGRQPHVLVMTATPIPRTLTLSLYGDLDVSVIDQLPAGRGALTTAVRDKVKLPELTKFLKERLDEGGRAYLVYPRIEGAGARKPGAVETEFPKWQKRLGRYGVGLVHGRMKGEEKDAVMEAFRAGRVKVLVCTSVIEVGVDVPEANVMVIHHAASFGLSQLHQLRGRVGRGALKSYCVLLAGKADATGIAKLNVLARTRDGFEVAEEDLRLRGPGELTGYAQSGGGGLRFVELLSDVRLLKLARRLASDILRKDPQLQGEEGARWEALIPESAPELESPTA